MATRACYKFETFPGGDITPSSHNTVIVYRHWDGYPSGAQDHLHCVLTKKGHWAVLFKGSFDHFMITDFKYYHDFMCPVNAEEYV